MPRGMVHARAKQRIISDPPSATVSPESGNPPDGQDLEDAEADIDDEGESMNISDDEEDVAANEDDDGDEGSQGHAPKSNRGQALSHFNSRKPTSSSQKNNSNNNNKSLKVPDTTSAAGSTSALGSRSAATMDPPDNRGTQPSDPPDSSVRRSSRVKPPSTSKEVSESHRSPVKKPLKIKLKLGAKPTPELDDEKPIPPTTATATRSSTRRTARGGRARAKGKGATALTLTLPARASEASSRRSISPSEASVRTSPESEDDPDAEMDLDPGPGPEPEPDLEAEEVNVDEQDDENMDEDGDDDDSEVLPGRGNRSRMTSRQAVLASKVDAEHVELTMTGPSRKKQLTTEEIALRREETARKRKNLNEKKLEDEKTETINRLLKKQSARSRAKRSALNTSVAVTPQSPHSGGEEGESEPLPVPEKPRGMPGPAWKWISSKDGYKLGIPIEVMPDVSLEPPPRPPPSSVSIPVCDVSGCSQNRKYRLVNDFSRGACGIEHLKLLSGKA